MLYVTSIRNENEKDILYTFFESNTDSIFRGGSDLARRLINIQGPNLKNISLIDDKVTLKE